MRCPENSELMLWLDDELPADRKRFIEEHLGSCADCRSLVETQRRIETLWREDWKDPDETAFEVMRKRIVAAPPWWRRQRTWFAVAAVFSVYLGVKIFYLDDAGRSLSEIAVESEESLDNEMGQEEFPRDTQFIHDAPETIALELCESEEEIDGTPDIVLSTDPDTVFAFSEVEQECANAAAPAEESQQLVELASSVTEQPEGYTGGLGGLAASADSTESLSLSRDESVSDCTVGDVFSEESAGFMSYGSGAAGGGGVSDSSLGGSSASRAVTGEEDAAVCDDSEHQETMACAEVASPCFYWTEPVLFIELENGEYFQLLRENWEELFQLADSIFSGDTICLHVDSAGLVTGTSVPEGTVLPLPDMRYGNCSVTVTNH